MRKVLMFLVLATVALLISGCGSTKTYTEISYTDLNKMLDDKESFVLFIGSATCTHCASYKVTLNKVIDENNVDGVYYIDVDNLSEKDTSSLQAKFPFSGTPTTIFIEKGEEESTFNRIEGEASYSEIVDALTENNYIKEK